MGGETRALATSVSEDLLSTVTSHAVSQQVLRTSGKQLREDVARQERGDVVCEARDTRSTRAQLPICHLWSTTPTHLTGAASHQLLVTSHGGTSWQSCHTSLLSPPSSLPQRQTERERGLGVYLVSGYEGSKESSCHHHKLHPLLTNTSCVTKRRPGANEAGI